jgi:dTDP-4-amino-4,6-dideoxygalactose transaminase
MTLGGENEGHPHAWRRRRHHHPLLGTNGRFDTIQAAVLLAKLPHFQWEVEERGRIGARYSAALRDILHVPAMAPGNTHVYAQYTIRLPDRDQGSGAAQGARNSHGGLLSQVPA